MSEDLQRVAKRIARQMASLQDGSIPQDAKGLALFMGLGLALGMCFEQATGVSFQTRKPQEILKWALALSGPTAAHPSKVRLT